MSVNKISKTTSAVKSAILRKSVRTLPNNPSAKGYKAEEIKKAMYDFATGESNSIMNEQDRIVNEINTAIDEINESFEQRDNNLSSHSSRKDNPHAVTATQIGLGNVNNTSDKDKPISNATQQELNKKVNLSDVVDNLTSDNADKPVSAKQAKNLKGLVDALNEEVKKKADLISTTQQLATKINASEKGATNGVAMLGDDGKVPVSQLPMSVLEQIIELVDFSASAPKVGINGEQYYNSTDKKIYTSNGTAWIGGETPLASKIYSVVAGANANKQYRWSGLDLVNIGSPLALGETSANAYPGDKGKLAYEHSLLLSGNPHGVTKEDVGLGNVENTKDEEKKVLSAKTLTNGVKINGETFDGSKDIEIFDDTKIPLLKEPVIVNENLNIFYDSYGRVTGGRLLQDGDIPELIARKEYVDGKETTLRGEINNKLNKNLGVENALKMLVTDKEGNISVNEIPEGTDITEDLTGLVNQNDDTLKKIASSAYMAKELNVKIETAKTNLSEDISNLETELATTNDNLQGAVNRIASDEEIIAKNTNARHTHSNKDILDKTTASFTVADRQKLDGIDPEADDITIDSALSSTSTNPVQNKVIKTALDNKLDKTANAVSATKATKDGDGNVIKDTYVKKSGDSMSGALTFTGNFPHIKNSTVDFVIEAQNGSQYVFNDNEFRPALDFANKLNIGRSDRKFKDAHFSGSVNTTNIKSSADLGLASESNIFRFGNSSNINNLAVLAGGNYNFFRPGLNNTIDLGTSSQKWKKGYFSDIVSAKSPETNSNAEELATTAWARDSIDITGQAVDMVDLVRGLINKTDYTKSAKYARWYCRINGATSNNTGSIPISNIPSKVAFVCEAICCRLSTATDYGYQLRFVAGGTHIIYRTYITQGTATVAENSADSTKKLPVWYQDVVNVGDQNISGVKTFSSTPTMTAGIAMKFKHNSMDITKTTFDNPLYQYIDGLDKNGSRVGVFGFIQQKDGYTGVYLQPRNNTGISVITNGSTVKTSAPTPPSTSNDTQIATTAWVKERKVLWEGGIASAQPITLSEPITNFRLLVAHFVDNSVSQYENKDIIMDAQNYTGYLIWHMKETENKYVVGIFDSTTKLRFTNWSHNQNVLTKITGIK